MSPFRSRFGHYQRLNRRDIECLPPGKRRQRKLGPLGGNVSRSGGKRKASSDAPERMRKRKKTFDSGRFSDRLDPSLSQGGQFVDTSTTTSDRYVGFAVTQSEADHVQVSVHPHHFFSDGYTGSLALTSPHKDAEQPDHTATQEDLYSDYNLHENGTPQEEIFEKYPHEMFADMFDIPLEHGLVVQYGHGESFALNQDQHRLAEGFIPHLGYLPERLAELFSI